MEALHVCIREIVSVGRISAKRAQSAVATVIAGESADYG
jgi:hypothetical protein